MSNAKANALLADLTAMNTATERVAHLRSVFPLGIQLSSQDVSALQAVASRDGATASERAICASRIRDGRPRPDFFTPSASSWGLCSESLVMAGTGEPLCSGMETDATIGEHFGPRTKVRTFAVDREGRPVFVIKGVDYRPFIVKGSETLLPNGRVFARYLARQNACKVCRNMAKDGTAIHAWEFVGGGR